MAKPRAPSNADRVIAPGTEPNKGQSGDPNALWRYEKQRRQNLLAISGPHTVVLVLDGLRADFNVPKIFRSAEVFGAYAVHLIGIGPFDPAPAKGGFRHVPAHFHDDFSTCSQHLREQNFRLVGLDPLADTCVGDAPLPERCAFVLGHEAYGLSDAAREDGELELRRIPQWGQVESLNVAVAASLALYEYTRQYGQPVPPPQARQQR